MNKLTLIGWYLAILAFLVTMGLCCSCCHKTYESVIRDTLIVERVDSVIVNMRDVDVDVPVPQITLEKWSPLDTMSILDNGYYQSIVEVVNGQIHHTLKPVSGAVFTGTVTVADTTTIEKEKETHHISEKEKEVVKEEQSWWAKTKSKIGSWTIAFVIALIIIIAVALIAKRKGIQL